MKSQGPPITQSTPNAWGGVHDMTRQSFVVELSDVNRKLDNWLGFCHGSVTIHIMDVGRVLTRMTDPKDPAYECWS